MGDITEPPTVLSLAATLVNLYRDAATTFDQLKSASAQRREAPPSRVLEENIDQAPEEIEKEIRNCQSRFGSKFENGDEDAASELQHIVEEVQERLLDKLREIAEKDEEIDCAPLASVAGSARDRAIRVLLDLKQRLLETESRRNSTESDPQPVDRSSTSRQSSQSSRRIEDAEGGADDEGDHPRRSHSASLLGFFRVHRHRTRSGDQSVGGRKPSKRFSMHRSPSPSESALKSDHDGPLAHENGDVDTSETRNGSKDSMTSTGSSERPSSTSAYRFGSASSQNDPPPSAIQPTAENDHLGFCKSAVRLQTGDRQAMQRTKEFNDGWSSSSVYYLTCSNSKCAFASHLDLESIWTKVWLLEEIGVKFRWPFLAKSHVCQSKKVRQSEYAYQCMFCVFSGEEGGVIDGTDSYLEHVSEVHRGRELGQVVLYRTSCVADRICEDEEDFDINIFPLTNEEQEQRLKEDQKLTDGQTQDLGPPGLPPLVSVETKSHWCEDMPDFQPEDTLEAIERQLTLRSFRSEGQG